MSWLSKGLKSLEHGISNLIPHQHSADRRAAMEATKQQMDYYRSAKEDLINAQATNKAEKEKERQRINEKEIRARKRAFRPAGFMNISPASGAVTDKLG